MPFCYIGHISHIDCATTILLSSAASAANCPRCYTQLERRNVTIAMWSRVEPKKVSLELSTFLNGC